ncbi:DUF559 domain-containing protein [Rhizobium sp.]|uniref:endonuclease domain-containing protein n=1 Tax=Rhizobium sp. TaxID=391 RepID=UPI0028AA54D5
MDSARKRTIIIRGAITAVLTAIGFAFPLVWIPAAFFAYTTYQAFPDPDPVTPESMYRPRQSTVTANDPDWHEYYLANCESPAETAFLEAMIKGYDLKPDNGILIAPGIELDMQTEYKPYRLDFLVNKWLVVEVDGAEWHSSPEAVERDGTRDEFFKAKGFAVLRIPAKVVFQTPTVAVERVRVAITRGRPPQKVMVQAPVVSVAKTFKNSMNAFGKFLDDTNEYVTKAKALQDALEPSELSFSLEKIVIGSALKSAKRSIELKDRLEADPNFRRHYEETVAKISPAIDKVQAKYEREATTKTVIEPILPPAAHPNAEINDAIVRKYSNLMEERTQYFEGVRSELSKDMRLRLKVLVDLQGNGYGRTFSEIFPPEKEVNIRKTFQDLLDIVGPTRAAPRSEPPPSS